ncbi:MAG: hypothetical protein ACI4J7_12575 [Ruminiclostridium sp.]
MDLKLIYTINWNEIHSNTGFCTNIPDAVNNLLSNDSVLRKNAYWKLDNHIVVQGTLYEGAFYIIPFLLSFIFNNIENGKKEVYNLLYEIANGWAECNNCVNFDYAKSENVIYFIPNQDNGIKLPLQLACRNAILSAWDFFKNELFNKNSDCRNTVLDIMFIYREYWHILQKYLKDIIHFEHSQFADEAKNYYNEITHFLNEN